MALAILGLGCVALDETLAIPDFPAEDAKVAILERSLRLGGITANALAAAARLGVRCGYAGTLGSSVAARAVLGEFARLGVDTTLVRRVDDAEPIRSTIMVSRRSGSRTVLYDLAGAVPATPDWPPPEAIRTAAVLLIDHFGMEGMLRAAKIATAAKVPIVATFESDQRPDFAEQLAQPDHLILAREFALRITSASTPSLAIERLWNARRQAVVVTCGADGCWFRAADASPQAHQVAAIPVTARDSTGCGDAFRGAYAAALVQFPSSLSLHRVRYATAAAALVAASASQDRFPERPAVEALFAQTWPMP